MPRKSYLPWLFVLFVLFVLRVIAQLIQKLNSVSFLPPFEKWQSGALSYWWLLFFQVLIIVVLGLTIRGFARQSTVPNRKFGKWVIAFGFIYLITMAFRLFAAVTFAANHPWFGAKIPAFFHIVLASFVLLVGHFHFKFGEKSEVMNAKIRGILTWTVYPAVMLISLLIYYFLAHYGVSLALSSYLAAIVGGLGLITYLELMLPYRKEWLPNRNEVKTDFVFMMLVQVLLPYLLSILAVSWLVDFIKNNNWNLPALWPHQYPVWIQMLIMLFTADFFRYWLHRAAHTWIPLWRFHAVHHSVQKLYWINVGRFHPVDKSLQFLCDALPFILLGVSKEVLTLYFVVYSIKGFFQHSNVDVKLGWFNYIISGPELHRWHHSKKIRESNTNYGNNIIVWDILFGTFFFPKDKEVSELGLLNRNYPMSFFKQMVAPFIKGSDKAK